MTICVLYTLLTRCLIWYTVSIAIVGKQGTYYIILKKFKGETPGYLGGKLCTKHLK